MAKRWKPTAMSLTLGLGYLTTEDMTKESDRLTRLEKLFGRFQLMMFHTYLTSAQNVCVSIIRIKVGGGAEENEGMYAGGPGSIHLCRNKRVMLQISAISVNTVEIVLNERPPTRT